MLLKLNNMALLVLGSFLMSHINADHTTPVTIKTLESMMAEMEDMAFELRDEAERVLGRRCTDNHVDSCYKENYDDCRTRYPAMRCMGGDVKIGECGECDGLFDYTVSNIVLPRTIVDDHNPTPNTPKDNSPIETVCSTRFMDDWFKDTMGNLENPDSDDFKKFGDMMPQFMIGTQDGVFRFFPARHWDNCEGNYDHRRRPWYVSAASGPRDVVIVIDKSGSMDNREGYMDLAKEAAYLILDGLTIGDHFSIVAFSSRAKSETPWFVSEGLIRATAENKLKAREWVGKLSASGTTDFLAAFDLVEDAFSTSQSTEKTSGCHKAVLFLTDGEMDSEVSMSDLNARLSSIRDNYEPIIFTYSLGANAETGILKEMACNNNGLWASIPDGEDLAMYMSSYYKLFASGLSDAANENFLSWVEPYAYATGGVMGTTVSVPVFDQEGVDPDADYSCVDLYTACNYWAHLGQCTSNAGFMNSYCKRACDVCETPKKPRFVGVVGIDFTVEAMESAGGASYSDVLDKLVSKSTAVCPSINLDHCMIEQLRLEDYMRTIDDDFALTHLGSGWCNANWNLGCSNWGETHECQTEGYDWDDIDLWHNYEEKDRSYTERTCCLPGTLEPALPSDFCALADKNLAGIIIGGFFGFILFAWWYARRRRAAHKQATAKVQHMGNDAQSSARPQQPVAQPVAQPVVNMQQQQMMQQQAAQQQAAAQQQQMMQQQAAQQQQMMMQQQQQMMQQNPQMMQQMQQNPQMMQQMQQNPQMMQQMQQQQQQMMMMMQQQGQQPQMQLSGNMVQGQGVQSFDTTGNGRVNMYGQGVDTTGDGKVNEFAVDTTGDGFPDKMIPANR